MAWAIAGATLAVGAASTYSANRASGRAGNAARNELEFSRQQYQDWLDVFGDIQENLSDYYTNLTPDTYETQALQAFEQEKALAIQQLQAEFDQRGLSTSGLTQQFYGDLAFQSAIERASIRAEAPIKTNQAKQEFLQIGLGQNPADNVYSAMANRTAQLNDDARLANQAAGKAVGAAVDTTFDALAKMLAANETEVIGAPTGNPNAQVGNMA